MEKNIFHWKQASIENINKQINEDRWKIFIEVHKDVEKGKTSCKSHNLGLSAENVGGYLVEGFECHGKNTL